jgi:hypothetical protein
MIRDLARRLGMLEAACPPQRTSWDLSNTSDDDLVFIERLRDRDLDDLELHEVRRADEILTQAGRMIVNNEDA